VKILIDMQPAQGLSAKGGIGRYASNLLEAMLRHNSSHDISILLNSNLPMKICDKLHSIISPQKIHTFESFKDTAEKLEENHFRSEAAKLTKEFVVSSINPDVFFIMSFVEGCFDNVVTSLEGIFPTERTVIILYDLIPLVQKEVYLKDPIIKKHYMKKVSDLSKCKLLLAISEFSKNEAIDMLKIDKNSIVNISSGVDKKFKPLEVPIKVKKSLYEKYGIKNRFIMYTSSFDARKNQKNLILAFASLEDNIRKDYQLLFIGNGSKKIIDRLKKVVIEAGLKQDEVIFLGYINDEELLSFYNLTSLFVFPSFSEGFGLPALEAMSCEAPTIGSNNTSIAEVINNKDAFFDPADIKSITDKIKKSLLDENFSNFLKSKGLEQAKLFSWDITAIKTLDAIEEKYKNLTQERHYTNQYSSFIKKLSKIENIEKVSDQELTQLSNHIQKNIKKYNKKIGIITTWNTRCGIASYTKYLSKSFINESIILAPTTDEKNLTAKDESNVRRIWKLSKDDLKQMLNYILSIKLETIFIQFNYGFFNFKDLDLFISHLVDCGIDVHITFHSTVDSVKNRAKKLELIKSLHKCTTIFIHTKQDIINLNKIGIKDNIVLLNQGIIDISPEHKTHKTTKPFILATYGFFLKTKGFTDMIKAFKILKEEGYDITLLMLNAKYTQEASGHLIKQATDLIEAYDLKNHIDLNTNYLSDEESIAKLHKTDLVVFPYKKTGESSSAAVRMAIAAQTNIAVTPQPIFDEVKEFSFVFEGDEVEHLVKGIKNSIKQIENKDKVLKEMVDNREKFRVKNLYSKLSLELKNHLC